ncbi:MAG: hypothetical protein AAF589_03015 [Planctomycetota bacterium]
MSLKRACVVVLTAATVVATAAFPGAQAQESVSVVVEGPTLADPAVAQPAPVVVAAPVTVAAPAVECCPIDILREVATLSAKRAYRCYGPPTSQVLCVDNPADCGKKLFSVPVCVPSCCVDTPVCVSSKVGLLGRGHVTYRWKCGFEAIITFRVHGGALITYR